MQFGRLSKPRARIVWTLALTTASMVLGAGPASAAPPAIEQPTASDTAQVPIPSVVNAPLDSSLSSAQADAGGRPGAAPSVIRKNQSVSKTGKTYGEWSAAWWQYVLSIPQSKNPLLDEKGKDCGLGQSARVFFLVGTFTSTVDVNGDVVGTANRSQCKIPAGKPLFIPILNAECSTVEGNGNTERELRTCANGFVSNVTELSLEVDGKKVPGLAPGADAFRADSPLFTFNLPKNNILQCPAPGVGQPPVLCPAGPSKSVADGYYVLLEPLSVGAHTIRIHGKAQPINPPKNNSFTLDVTYKPLVVQPRH
jgi:hypothetical protein